MNGVRVLVAVSVIVLGAACASPGRGAPVASPQGAPATGSAPSANTASARPANGRLAGTVESTIRGGVILQDGGEFTVGPDAVVIRSEPVDEQALEPGSFVAVTAKRQSDGSLAASIVNIFPESMRGMSEGQRPMDAGNIMTNATIDDLGPNITTNATVAGVTGQTFTVSFPGGGDQVHLADDARINQFEAADAADLVPGTAITASVNNGSAQFITIVHG